MKPLASAPPPAAPPLVRGRILAFAREPGRALPYFLYAPESAKPGAPIFVCVHGLARNAVSHVMRFRRHAEKAGAICLAPYFSKRRHRHFQRLAPGRNGDLPDVALNAALDEAARMLNRPPGPAHFFGYSGGGQFVHRYAMLHPERVTRAVLAAPGWFTFPDEAAPFPLGLAAAGGRAAIAIERFLAIPVSVIVGERDCERDAALNKSEIVDRAQGANRIERARNWVAAIAAAGVRRGVDAKAKLLMLPRAGHCFEQGMDRRGLGEMTFRELFPDSPAGVAMLRPSLLAARERR